MARTEVVVHRFDPECDAAPRFESYEVPITESTSVLDTLFHIQEVIGENLPFRFSCRQGVCGSCCMEINGESKLAYQTAVTDLDDEKITVRPLYNPPVMKDLIVDMDPFFEAIEDIDPVFESDTLDEDTDPAVIEPDSRERQLIEPRTDCIGCGACYSSCSVAGDTYLDPAALNLAVRLIEDSRDSKTEERLARIMESDGVWSCHTQRNCTDVCPKDIPVSEGRQYLKREAVKHGVKRRLLPGGD